MSKAGIERQELSPNRGERRFYEGHFQSWHIDRGAKGYTLWRQVYSGTWEKMPVRGQEVWGEGWAWTRAERVAMDVMAEWWRSRS